MSTMLKTYRFTVDEYHRMGEAGIFSEDDRVELLAGAIVEMSRIGPLYAGTVDRLTTLFSSRLGNRVIVRIQNPLLLRDNDSEPRPDVALLRPHVDCYTHVHPEAHDVYLIIEVADTSVAVDRNVKFPIYARAGVPEAWLLDVSTRRVEVTANAARLSGRAPSTARRTRCAPGVPCDLALTIDDLLG